MAFLVRILGFIICPFTVLAAPLLPEGDWALCTGPSFIQYKVVHSFHDVIGKTTNLEARTVLSATDGKVMVRIPIKNFDSGNSNRDQHMLEVLQAHQFPYVIFRGELKPGKNDTKLASTGTLDFHGVQKPLETEIEWKKEGEKIITDITFQISLDQFHVERPSLMFIKIDDAVQIKGHLEFFKKDLNSADCSPR